MGFSSSGGYNLIWNREKSVLSVHYVLLCMPIVNDSVDKSMKKGFILFSHYNSHVLSPLVQFCLKDMVIQRVEMSYNTDVWTKNLKTMRLKVGLTYLNCLNEDFVSQS